MNNVLQLDINQLLAPKVWGSALLGFGIALIFLYFRSRNAPEPPLPPEKQIGGHIKEILVFPVKSLAGLSLKESEIDLYGFKYDRSYMLANREPMTEEEIAKKGAKKGSNYATKTSAKIHMFLTSREYPQMAIVRPTIDEPNNLLRLKFDGDDHILSVPLVLKKTVDVKSLPVLETVVWGNFMHAYDIESVATLTDPSGAVVETSTPINDFFSDIVKITVPVTLLSPHTRRDVNPAHNGPDPKELGRTPESSFQDYFPGNLITEASMEALSEKLVERNVTPPIKLSSFNFRPNLVLTGTTKPWDEDEWKDITIVSKDDESKHEWYVSCHNVRCQVPTISLTKGTFHEQHEPYKTMATFRRIDKGAPYTPCFGMNLVQKTHGYKLHVGDKVVVTKRAPADPIAMFTEY